MVGERSSCPIGPRTQMSEVHCRPMPPRVPGPACRDYRRHCHIANNHDHLKGGPLNPADVIDNVLTHSTPPRYAGSQDHIPHPIMRCVSTHIPQHVIQAGTCNSMIIITSSLRNSPHPSYSPSPFTGLEGLETSNDNDRLHNSG